MIFFLEKAHVGITMNMVSYLKPTHADRSDSWPMGMGGYSNKGYAWRWYLPIELQFRASNNLVEHLASIITVWIDILNDRIGPGYCSLSMTDSSFSEDWQWKSNFSEEIEEPIQATVRLEITRHHAMLMLENEIKDYSQWFKGKENEVADAFSRDDNRSDKDLTNILCSHVPEQMP